MTRTLSLSLIASTLFACDADTKEVTTGLECGPGTEAADGLCVPTEGDTDEPGDDSGEPPGDDSGVPEPDDTGETDDTGSGDDTGFTEDTGALDDTGFIEDTGEPLMAGGCSDDLSFGEAGEAEGTFDVGSFLVQLDGSGELFALHVDDFSHGVFHSAPGGWLSVGDHDLHAEEHQGSFDIEIEESFSCNAPRFTESRRAEGALELSGTFDDDDTRCTETTFSIVICEAGDNRLSFSLTADSPSALNFSSIRVRSRSSERIYGMGEQFPHDTLNLKGRQIAVIAEEGGVGRGHPIIAPAVDLASPGSAGNEGTTYYAAPQYLTSDLSSVFLKNTEYAEFDFREDDATEIRLYDEQMQWEALYGETPLELIEGFTDYAGRMPAPPDWTQSGAIVALARPLEDSLGLVDDLIADGVKVAGVWNQTWSGINVTFIGEQVLWNWILDEDEHPGWHDWVSDLADRDVRTLCYVNSMFLDISDREVMPPRHLFAEGEEAGYFVKNEEGDTLLLPVTAFDVAMLDFTSEDAREWMKDVIIDEMVENAGCSGWMVDFAEALPFEAELHDGTHGAEYHNKYPVEWMRLNREAIEDAGLLGDILTFNRSGHTRSPAHSLMFWEGDQLTTWDRYDGITSALRGLINGGFSGLALNHSDTGGYTSLSRFGLGYSRPGELLKRWGEMSAFTSLLRTHEGNQPEANAQVYHEDQREHFAWASKVFAGLSEYRTTLFEEAEAHGWPVVRHLWLHYPDDIMAHESDDQFMLGDGFLVAPVLERCGFLPWCTSSRDVYLPKGSWTHLWSGDIIDGPASLRVDAPLQQPPVYFRSDDAAALAAVDRLRAADVGVFKE